MRLIICHKYLIMLLLLEGNQNHLVEHLLTIVVVVVYLIETHLCVIHIGIWVITSCLHHLRNIHALDQFTR